MLGVIRYYPLNHASSLRIKKFFEDVRNIIKASGDDQPLHALPEEPNVLDKCLEVPMIFLPMPGDVFGWVSGIPYRWRFAHQRPSCKSFQDCNDPVANG